VQSSSGRAALASPLRRPPCGISLQDLSGDAKKDPKVVKIAVSLDCCALQYAHEDRRKVPSGCCDRGESEWFGLEICA
jgi:hypothetical protein